MHDARDRGLWRLIADRICKFLVAAWRNFLAHRV